MGKYNFYQVHWHTPSENTVDGQSFPLEAHFVHQLSDDPDGAGIGSGSVVGTYHRLAVIGLLYELGDCNTFLNAKLAMELADGYYHWYGSLTTPPCTEGVSWNL